MILELYEIARALAQGVRVLLLSASAPSPWTEASSWLRMLDVKGVADYDQGMNGKATVMEAVETTRAKTAVLLKADLIEEVSGAVEVPAKEAAIIVELIFDKMVRALRSGDKIELRGFGSFNTRERRARTGRNPKTGAAVKVPAKKIAFFKPSRELKELVQNSKTERPL